MPEYSYHHPKNPQKIVTIIQTMTEPHRYVDEKGVEWVRIWEAPLPAVDSKIDPFSETKFVEKTGKGKGTIGDLWDRSKEWSLKREDKVGATDPTLKKYFENYRKKRNGKAHIKEIQQRANKTFEL